MPYVFTALAALSTLILWTGNHSSYLELSLTNSYLVSIVYAFCAITALSYAMARVEYRLF